MSSIKYRPKIDGLRSIAVLAVIFCHFGLGCADGYTGVDIFFVISGFLISSILFQELYTGAFNLAHFWARRARRILAALRNLAYNKYPPLSEIVTQKLNEQAYATFNAMIDTLSKEFENLTIIDLSMAFFNVPESRLELHSEQSHYYDNNHLSGYGAKKYLTPIFEPILSKIDATN